MNHTYNYINEIWLTILEWISGGYSGLLYRAEDLTIADQDICKKEQKAFEYLRTRKRRPSR